MPNRGKIQRPRRDVVQTNGAVGSWKYVVVLTIFWALDNITNAVGSLPVLSKSGNETFRRFMPHACKQSRVNLASSLIFQFSPLVEVGLRRQVCRGVVRHHHRQHPLLQVPCCTVYFLFVWIYKSCKRNHESINCTNHMHNKISKQECNCS